MQIMILIFNLELFTRTTKDLHFTGELVQKEVMILIVALFFWYVCHLRAQLNDLASSQV